MNINLMKASPEELKAYGRDELGISLSLTMKPETMRQRIIDACNEQGKPVPISKEDDGPKDAGDGYTKIVIQKQDKPGGSDPVFVGYQGRGYTIPRGVPVDVPNPVVHILENAIQDIHTQDPETGEMVTQKVPSYPFQVLSAA